MKFVAAIGAIVMSAYLSLHSNLRNNEMRVAAPKNKTLLEEEEKKNKTRLGEEGAKNKTKGLEEDEEGKKKKKANKKN